MKGKLPRKWVSVLWIDNLRFVLRTRSVVELAKEVSIQPSTYPYQGCQILWYHDFCLEFCITDREQPWRCTKHLIIPRLLIISRNMEQIETLSELQYLTSTWPVFSDVAIRFYLVELESKKENIEEILMLRSLVHCQLT